MDKIELLIESIVLPSGCNVVLGQSHFIKTAEDLYQVLAESAPGIKFGVAFCEASGARLVRSEGNDDELVRAAEKELLKVGAGHVFLVFLRNAFPVNCLNAIKGVSEVANVYCATANSLQVIVAQTDQGRGVVGVVDGQSPLGVESLQDKAQRRELLKKFGYRPV